MKVIFQNFKGRADKVQPKLLPENFAQTAENCDLREAKIKPMADLSAGTTFTNPGALRSFFKFGSNWLYWTESDICAHYLQLAASSNRVIYTGDGYVKQTDTTLMAASGIPDGTDDYRKVGITAPSAALTINIEGSGDGTVQEDVSYVYTYVVAWADGTEEESAPSPATAVTEIENGENCSLQNFVIPTLASTGNNITHCRLYRLKSGVTGASYKHVKARATSVTETGDFWYDIPIASVPTTATKIYDSDGTADYLWDNSADAEIETTDWEPPPTDLENLVQYQNGLLAGNSGRSVCVSVWNVFYAWPTDYQIDVDYDIVGLGVYNNSLIVLTDAFYYIVSGTDEATLQKSEPIEAQKCLSTRGIVSTKMGVMYPCPQGMFLVNTSGGRVFTENILTREQWEDLPPSGSALSDIIGFYYDNRYIGFFSGTSEGFSINLEGDVYLETIDIGTPNVYHGVIDPSDNDLILLTNTGGADYYAQEYERHASNKLTYTWKSKVIQLPKKVRFGVCRIKGTQSAGNAITFKMYGDGSQVQTRAGSNFSKSVTDEKPFRIPGGKRYEEFVVEVSSSAAEIDSIEIAGVMDEL